MGKQVTIRIDDVEYVRKDSVLKKEVIIQKNETLASAMIGRFVLVRSRNEGLNAGTVVAADKTGVILSDCRRIWYHKPADKSLSWYEGVAVSGLSADSKVSGTVPTKVIIEDYSLTVCSEDAKNSIMEKAPNAQ